MHSDNYSKYKIGNTDDLSGKASDTENLTSHMKLSDNIKAWLLKNTDDSDSDDSNTYPAFTHETEEGSSSDSTTTHPDTFLTTNKCTEPKSNYDLLHLPSSELNTQPKTDTKKHSFPTPYRKLEKNHSLTTAFKPFELTANQLRRSFDGIKTPKPTISSNTLNINVKTRITQEDLTRYINQHNISAIMGNIANPHLFACEQMTTPSEEKLNFYHVITHPKDIEFMSIPQKNTKPIQHTHFLTFQLPTRNQATTYQEFFKQIGWALTLHQQKIKSIMPFFSSITLLNLDVLSYDGLLFKDEFFSQIKDFLQASKLDSFTFHPDHYIDDQFEPQLDSLLKALGINASPLHLARSIRPPEEQSSISRTPTPIPELKISI